MKMLISLALLLSAWTGFAIAQERNTADYFISDGYFEVPLQVSDNSGVARSDWPVTSGIPLPPGVVHELDSLALLDEQGSAIPTQFAPLSRYSARDNSVRWLLLDFQASLQANATRRFVLTNLRRPSTSTPKTQPGPAQIAVTEHEGNITIDTGPLRATVSGKNGRIFDSLELMGKPVITLRGGGTPFIRSRAIDKFLNYLGDAWNTHGWEHETRPVERRIAEAYYFGNTADPELVIEEKGPLRTTLRLRGTHLPSSPREDTVNEGLYNYTLRLHFFAGKSFIKAQFDVENSATEQPQWNFPFLEAGLLQELAFDQAITVTAGVLDAKAGEHRFFSMPLKEGSTARLQQSAPGEPKDRKDAASLSRATLLAIAKDHRHEVLAQGNVARFLDVSDADKGLVLGMRYFWQEGPRAIEVSNHRVRLIPLAADSATPHGEVYDLDFGQRYLNDLLLYFHGPSTDSSDLLSVVEAFDYPLAAVAPPAWHANTETWYFEVGPVQPRPASGTSANAHWKTTAPNTDFRADQTNYNSGGHHESLNSSWLTFLLTGSLTDFERLEIASRWHVARNPGWAYRDNVIAPQPGGDLLKQLDRKLLQWDRLTGFGPKDFMLWRASGPDAPETGGESYLNRYKQLPDIEHYANFILFEYYYLTGDRRALDSIHGFVNWALNYQHRQLFNRELRPLSEHDYFRDEPEALRRGHYSRIYSWMLYTTLAGFHATGSPVMEHFAIWQIRRALSLLRHRHGQFTSWDVKPGLLLAPLDPDLQHKIAEHFDYPLVRRKESVHSSSAQSWMEAQNVLALHEAYKTYQDERILDALWGMADYFAHHVIFYPELGAFTRSTGMPTPLLTEVEQVSPRLHDRHIQVLPLLYHYTGWADIEKRYRRVQEVTRGRYINKWFTQTSEWEANTKPKSSSHGPEAIRDLTVTNTTDSSFALRWTSPRDDGPRGHASRYFVKVSAKPIVEFAPTDNPRRAVEKQRIVGEVERAILARSKDSRGQLDYSVDGITFARETSVAELADPDWHNVDAFWMAEHVAGETEPQPAGQTEHFVVRELNLHSWFGSPERASLADLHTDTLYAAVCSWDEDNNLSALSNVVQVRLH